MSWSLEYDKRMEQDARKKVDLLVLLFRANTSIDFPDLYDSFIEAIKSNEDDVFVTILRNFVSINEDFQNIFYSIAAELGYLPKTDIIKSMSDLAKKPFSKASAFEKRRSFLEFEKKRLLWEKNKHIYFILKENNKSDIMMNTSFGTFIFKSDLAEYGAEILSILLNSNDKKIIDFEERKDLSKHVFNASLDYFILMKGKEFRIKEYQNHFATELFGKMHPENRIITSEMPNVFSNSTRLQSYNYDPKTDNVIDLVNGIVMPISQFNQLFEPKEILNFPAKDINELFSSYRSDRKFNSGPGLKEIAAYERLKTL